MKFFSPAKINLFFRVLKKRIDGYHEIVSLMKAISIGDILQIQKGNSHQIRFSEPALDKLTNTTVHQALSLFEQACPGIGGVNIEIEKQIPSQAGLGGGSSNAATALFALNALFDFPLSEKQIQEIGSRIGADVSFFFSHGSAIVQGIGEQVFDFNDDFEERMTIVKPSFGMATPQVYQHLDLNRCYSHSWQDLIKKNLWINDLESSAFALEPQLANLKKSLYQFGFNHVLLSGSGSSMICFGEGDRDLTSLRNCECFFPVHAIQRKERQWYSVPLLT